MKQPVWFSLTLAFALSFIVVSVGCTKMVRTQKKGDTVTVTNNTGKKQYIKVMTNKGEAIISVKAGESVDYIPDPRPPVVEHIEIEEFLAPPKKARM